MATSGTYSFNLDIGDIIEESYERAGVELRSGYDYRTARRSLDLLMLEWQNRGLNLWTVQSGSIVLTPGTGRYALPSKELDIIEAFIRTDAGNTSSQSDLMMQRISVSQYSHLTNKLTEARPLQYWIEKDPSQIAINLWPVPDTAETYTLCYYYMERVQDSGKPSSNNMDVPSRWLPCLVSGLAYQISVKRPEVSERAPLLKQVYDEQWELASDADREKAALYVVPGGYQYL
jgi:hypothetical protein